MLALVLSLIALNLTQLLYRLTLPTDGWVMTGTSINPEVIYQTNLAGGASLLQPADQLLAVGGVPVIQYRPGVRPADWVPGQTVQITVLRMGETLTVAVPVLHWTWQDWWRYSTVNVDQLVGRVSALFLLGVALFTFFRRPGDPAARALLAWLGGFFALNLSRSLPGGLTTRFDELGFWSNFLFSYGTFVTPFGPALLSLALVFPRPKTIVRRHPWLALAPYVIGALWLVVVIASGQLILAFVSTLLVVLAAIISLLHSALTMRETVSRAQLQWGIGGLVLGLLVTLLAFAPVFGWVTGSWAPVLLSSFNVGFTLMGVALSVAILRYRLFDIDVIIRRTLLYTVLTGLLAAVYFGIVVVLQIVLRTLTGQGQSQLATVVSTLAIAALFVPLRRRVQAFIDRRFYRHKYDTARILSVFSANVRDDVDLDDLTRRMLAVVEETMQPMTVGIWLRPPPTLTASRWRSGPESAGTRQPV